MADRQYSTGKYFEPVPGARYKYDYQHVWDRIEKLQKKERSKKRKAAIVKDACRFLCRDDLYFLMYFGLSRKDLNDPIGAPFFVERCNEVQVLRNRTLDLWAREHAKSSIVTIGLTIQDILRDPESTTGIFSHSRPASKKFLEVIRGYLADPVLINWFPDILWDNPEGQASSWGLDSGVVVKRRQNKLAATVEAWGLVDSMPTGKHFQHRVYDDVVDEDTVTTPEQIEKAKDRFNVSHSLKERGDKSTMRIVGTRYHYDDPYADMIDAGTYKVRIQTVYGGTATEGRPVIFTPEEAQQRRRDHGPYKWSCQYELSPISPGEQKLRPEWIDYYDRPPQLMNVYIVCDPANEKKKSRNHSPDYTVMWVVGFGPQGYAYVVDGVRARLNLGERWRKMKDLVRRWQPKCVGYERYGKDSDIQHFEHMQREENMRFKIVELGGTLSKFDRIQRLVPLLEQKKLLFPRAGIMCPHPETNKVSNLVQSIMAEEMATWPFSRHDDMLDCLSRIQDRSALGITVPYDNMYETQQQEVYSHQMADSLDAELLI